MVALALSCVAGSAQANSGADTSEVVDSQEVVDPEEIVTDQGEPVASGPPNSLCIIQESPDTAKILFITYAEHDFWRPCHGKNRSPMTYAEFYNAIGRPDLLDSHEGIDSAETVLFWSQFALTLGAFGFAVVALFNEDSTYLWPAGGMLAGVITLSIIRGSTSPLPIDTQEAMRLADTYNRGSAQQSLEHRRFAPRDARLVVPLLGVQF